METQPLTVEQQNVLKARACMSTALVGGAVLVICLILACLIAAAVAGGNRTVLAIFVVTAAIILLVVVGVTVWVANKIWSDANAGVAQVRVTRLLGTSESRRAPKQYYGVFEGIGPVLLAKDIYDQLRPGAVYRVTFSPRSRHGWNVEPILK